MKYEGECKIKCVYSSKEIEENSRIGFIIRNIDVRAYRPGKIKTLYFFF